MFDHFIDNSLAEKIKPTSCNTQIRSARSSFPHQNQHMEQTVTEIVLIGCRFLDKNEETGMLSFACECLHFISHVRSSRLVLVFLLSASRI